MLRRDLEARWDGSPCTGPVSICYSHIKQEVKYVLVKLPTFGPTTVISTQLIPTINATHIFVVVDDALWTVNSHLAPILLSPKNCTRYIWLRVCGQNSDDFVVTPCTSHQRALLENLGITSVGRVCLFHCFTYKDTLHIFFHNVYKVCAKSHTFNHATHTTHIDTCTHTQTHAHTHRHTHTHTHTHTHAHTHM